MQRRASTTGSALALALTCALGCRSVGPRTVAPDHFDYGRALQTASSEQLLLNMVRLRYDEPPVFLTVSSLISQYRQSASATLGAGWDASVTGGDTASVGVGTTWVDRPTITYTPITGREFATKLLRPIPPDAIFSLLQSGWPADLVVRVSIVSINGIRNEVTRPSRRRAADPAFWELMELWRRLRDAEALGMRQETHDGETETRLRLRTGGVPAGVAADQARFRQILFLDPGVDEFRLVAGLIPSRKDEIAVLTGSIRDIMLDLAWRFDVPDEHVTEGRTDPTFVSDVEAPIHVHYAEHRPRDAFVAVESRGHWFYIDDRDRASKRGFSFLHMLTDLAQSGEEPARGPILTID